MISVLDRIIAHKREELARLTRERPLAEVQARAAEAPAPRDFAVALDGPTVAVIAEVKQASPSAGVIRADDFQPARIAAEYEAAGAAAVSVLTDEEFFRGSLGHLQEVRAAISLPALRKDFVVDEYQLYESRGAGADAVLLIVAALEPGELQAFLTLAGELGLAALVEVHDERELAMALEAGARIVGINNRDLTTFEVDLRTTERLAPVIPQDHLVVGESGVSTRAHVERLAQAGVNAVLVGTALMRAESPAETLRALTGVGVSR